LYHNTLTKGRGITIAKLLGDKDPGISYYRAEIVWTRDRFTAIMPLSQRISGFGR